MPLLQRPMNVGLAVLIGIAVVNVPVWVLLVGPAIIGVRMENEILAIAGLPLGFVLAWCWWSLAAPRWRLWAYERVSSTGELQQAAVEAGLLWKKGSFFERTEFRSPAQRKRQEELERHFP